MISENRDLSKRNLGAQKCYVYVAKFVAVIITKQINSSLAAKD